MSTKSFTESWAFASELKDELNAATYEVQPMGTRFKSGREKYLIVFFSDENSVISKRIGMELTSKKTNENYKVFSRTEYKAPSPDDPTTKAFREKAIKEMVEALCAHHK